MSITPIDITNGEAVIVGLQGLLERVTDTQNLEAVLNRRFHTVIETLYWRQGKLPLAQAMIDYLHKEKEIGVSLRILIPNLRDEESALTDDFAEQLELRLDGRGECASFTCDNLYGPYALLRAWLDDFTAANRAVKLVKR